MKNYYPRVLENVVKKYLETFSVIGITGPRQSGKTTMLKEMFDTSYRYISFDDYRLIEFFYDDPEKFIKQFADKVIFDEVQKVPEIFNYIKIAVDADRDNKGKFVITGSSQFSFIQKITESLAGRIGLLTLLPFQYAEIPQNLRYDSIYKGCYPEIIKSKFKNYLNWYSSYLETFVLKDVKSLINIGDLRDFRQFIKLLASQTAQILNMSGLSRTLGISVSTVKRWISVLEAAYIIFLLPPYFSNLGKRIIKSPKVYFYDTGLVSLLTGILNKEVYEQGPMAGNIFENYVISEIKKKLFHNADFSQMFYSRTSNDVEVDLIIEKPNHKEFIEIKKSATFRTGMIKPIEKIMNKNDIGYLLYEGGEFPYKDNIRIIKYSQYIDE